MPAGLQRGRAIALLGGGVAAGVIGAVALGASAQTTTGTAPSTSSSSTAPAPGQGAGPRYNSNETPVTGTKADALKAAALKQLPGATVDGVSTEDPSEGTGAAYEVHVTKSDGSHATLLFDAALKYLKTETGGPGGPRGHGGPRGGGPGETPVTGSKATTLKAAALKQVPGATVDAVSTDSGDAAFEVHLTKSDGTKATVKFDKNLAFVSVEDGMGK